MISTAFSVAMTQAYLIQRFQLISKLWYGSAFLISLAGLLVSPIQSVVGVTKYAEGG